MGDDQRDPSEGQPIPTTPPRPEGIATHRTRPAPTHRPARVATGPGATGDAATRGAATGEPVTREAATGEPAADEAGATGADDEPASHVLPDEVEYPQPDAGGGSALPPRVERWRRRSATGAMLTGFALGLREVIEPQQREPAVILETSGVPPRDLPVEADLDNLPPRQSVVKIRRWLLHDGPESDRTDPAAEEGDGRSTAGPTEDPAAAARSTEMRIRPRRARPRRIFGGHGKGS